LVKADNKAEKSEGYGGLLCDARSLLEKAKYHAYKAVDNYPIVATVSPRLSWSHCTTSLESRSKILK